MLLVVCPATDWCFCLLLPFMECQAAESVVFEGKTFCLQHVYDIVAWTPLLPVSDTCRPNSFMSFTLQRFDFGQRDETNKDKKTTHETTVRKTNSSVQKSFRKNTAAKRCQEQEWLPCHVTACQESVLPRKRWNTTMPMMRIEVGHFTKVSVRHGETAFLFAHDLAAPCRVLRFLSNSVGAYCSS